MLIATSKPGSRWLFVCALCALCLGVSSVAKAEESIIRHPGDHPNYTFEIEPHLDFAFFLPTAGSTGVGLGGRFTIPVVKNGFVSTINNNVGVGFGLDWLHYNGCYRYYFVGPNYPYCTNLDSFWIPVVMQWNFFLATHWSVFGEPGLSIVYHNFGDYACVDNRGFAVPCGPGPNHVDLEPVIFFGGRYHFSEGAALILRIGWPYASFGVSFFP